MRFGFSSSLFAGSGCNKFGGLDSLTLARFSVLIRAKLPICLILHWVETLRRHGWPTAWSGENKMAGGANA